MQGFRRHLLVGRGLLMVWGCWSSPAPSLLDSSGGGLQPQAALHPPRLPAGSTIIFPSLPCLLQNSAPWDAQLSTQPLPCMLSI